MPQDQASGAAANDYGRETARRIATAIGARIRGSASNEADYDGRRVVIKCARAATSSVGVTYKMLERLQEVVGAFESSSGEYELFALPVSEFRKYQRPTASAGAAAGKVGLVSRAIFVSHGRFLKRVPL